MAGTSGNSFSGSYRVQTRGVEGTWAGLLQWQCLVKSKNPELEAMMEGREYGGRNVALYSRQGALVVFASFT